jgi:GR25 family glycosyltransferase involved in LPS biosynthesis
MSHLLDFFDAAYLINLPERTDRLRLARKQLARANLPLGPTGVRVLPAFRYDDPAGFPSAPERGCFCSHLACLRNAHAEGLQSVLILEDDIGLSSALPRLSTAIGMRLAAEPWDFVYFGHHGTGGIRTASRDTTESELRFDLWTGDVQTAEFYAISGRILPRLIEHLESIASGRTGDQEGGPMPVDGAYNIFRRKNRDVRCLIAHPRLGWQLPSRSSISPHPLDRIALLRPVNSLLRRFKQAGSLWRA